MKQARRMLSILLTLVLLLGSLAVGFSAFAAEKGSIIKFGSYPQSEVTNTKLIGALADVQKHWKSFGYYSGNGSWDNGAMKASDFAKYADFIYGNEAYRAIVCTKYRPKQTGAEASATSGNGSGYATDFIYYFKYEPIEWIVLDATSGLLMSKKVLDSQPYQNVVKKNGDKYLTGSQEANSYAGSSLRAFLNGSFYNVAFSPAQQTLIKDGTYDCTPYGSTTAASVTDKVTVLSYEDCQSTGYGFSATTGPNTARMAGDVTAYAVSQGISLTDGRAAWWLRTPDSTSGRTCTVEPNGSLSHSMVVNWTDKGVRPVIAVKTVADNLGNGILDCPHMSGTESFAKVEATCETAGHEAYAICNDCSKVVSGSNEVIPATGHVDKVMRSGEKGADGWCDVCGDELMVHLDNSGSLQLDGPMKSIMDLIRKLVQKLEELMGKFSTKKDGKSDGTATQTDTSSSDSDVDLSETGKNLDAFADVLGTIINAFKGISDKKSAEKEEDRSNFLDFLTSYANDGSTTEG